jgi:hypothetical protein
MNTTKESPFLIKHTAVGASSEAGAPAFDQYTGEPKNKAARALRDNKNKAARALLDK